MGCKYTLERTRKGGVDDRSAEREVAWKDRGRWSHKRQDHHGLCVSMAVVVVVADGVRLSGGVRLGFRFEKWDLGDTVDRQSQAVGDGQAGRRDQGR